MRACMHQFLMILLTRHELPTKEHIVFYRIMEPHINLNYLVFCFMLVYEYSQIYLFFNILFKCLLDMGPLVFKIIYLSKNIFYT